MPHHLHFGRRDSQTSSRTHRLTFPTAEPHTPPTSPPIHYSGTFPRYNQVQKISHPLTIDKETEPIYTSSPEAAAKNLLDTVAQWRISVNSGLCRVHVEKCYLPNGHECCIALLAHSVDGHEGELTIYNNSHHEHEKSLLEALEESVALLKQAEKGRTEAPKIKDSTCFEDSKISTESIEALVQVKEERGGEPTTKAVSRTGNTEKTSMEGSQAPPLHREFATEKLHYKAYIEHNVKVQNHGGDLFMPTTIASRLSFHWEVSITEQKVPQRRQLGWLVI